tara:strand:+ start:1514 stop:1960 length:447 start_codon:yes stop_codon:yes gene_type:complete
MKQDLKNLITTLASLGFAIILYFIAMKKAYGDDMVNKDPLNKQVVNAGFLGKNCCSWWPVSHFIAFSIFAYIWPQYWKELFVLGVSWEGVEWVFKKIQTAKGKEMKFKRTRTLTGNVEYEQWWSSSSKDILFNAAGIMVGLYIRRKTK